jgi:hypothetical protein
MKKTVFAVLMAALLAPAVNAAHTADVTVLDNAEVAKLSNDDLISNYIDALAEIEAIRAYHVATGFSRDEYEEYRTLIRYRLNLLMVIHTRNIDLPPQME